MPKVSVIVPNYNHSKYLKQRIESILNQTYTNFELILLDDCSTDDSVIVLKEYENHPKVSHIILNDKNTKSPFVQWERGVRLAVGNYIWIAESDDWAENTFLEEMINNMSRFENVVLGFSAVCYVNSNGKSLDSNRKYSEKKECYDGVQFINERLSVECLIDNVSSVLFKKEAYLSSQMSNINNYNLCGDWLFYILLAEKGKIFYYDKPLSNFRRHPKTTSLRLEKEGIGLTEGIEILEYLYRKKYITRKLRNLFLWGRKWNRNRSIYDYSDDVNKKIKNVIKGKFNLIIFFYYLIRIKKKIIRLKKV